MSDQTDRLFVEAFKHVQEDLLQIQQVNEAVESHRQDVGEPYFDKDFFPKIRQGIDDLVLRYRGVESSMLSSYQSLRKEKIAKAGQAKEEIKQLMEQFAEYFETKVSGEIGHQIRNEDAVCEQVKDLIVKIEKVEFLMSNYMTSQSQSKDQKQQLKQYKTNLQSLLQVYEGSMDERILESCIGKFNFDVDNSRDQITKVKQITR